MTPNEVQFSNPPGAPTVQGQYSTVAVVPSTAGLIFVAGMLPMDDKSEVIAPGDFRAQADLVFDNLAATLRGAGSSLDDVVMLRTFMTTDEHWPIFREARHDAYLRHGVQAPPPATTIMAKSLIGGSLIELDAVAVRRGG
jgi:enamine deaminase RidA (YjgF/YER057c/UK114 family)